MNSPVKPALILAAVGAAVILVPLAAPPYYVTLMLPFMAYGVVLLGFNLLFGYTGLLSFGHAMFLGVGAKCAPRIKGV